MGGELQDAVVLQLRLQHRLRGEGRPEQFVGARRRQAERAPPPAPCARRAAAAGRRAAWRSRRSLRRRRSSPPAPASPGGSRRSRTTDCVARDPAAILRSETKLDGAGTCAMVNLRISQGASASASGSRRAGQQHLERQRQQRAGRRHDQRLHPVERTRHAAQRQSGTASARRRCRTSADRSRSARCRRAPGAPVRRSDFEAAIDPGHRDGAVAQQEHPAVIVAERDRGERLVRMQRGEHVLRRHHLLHELAVVRRGRLQGRVGVGQRGLRIADLLVEIGAGRRSARSVAPCRCASASSSRWRYSSASLADASCRRRIASATLGSREFSDSRAVAWAICWLVMPPCASCAAVNISASSAWRWSFCRSAAAA